MQARIKFKVIAKGVATDGTKYEYILPKQIENLPLGSVFSMDSNHAPYDNRIRYNDSIFIESEPGPETLVERRHFSTLGPTPGNEGRTFGVAQDLSHLDPDRQQTKDPCQSRLVPKTSCPNKEDLEAWLRYETGGYVSMVGQVIDRGLNWEILTVSPDGKPVHSGPTFTDR